MANFAHIPLVFLFILRLISAENVTDSAEETLNFVNDALNKLKIVDNPDIILVIGVTGSGKSTLIHYVAGDYSKLTAIESADLNALDLEVRDGLDPVIGEVISTSRSRTLIPERVIDEENVVWFDCPGFGDTRNKTMEIATAFLIKSVIESGTRMKLMLVASYETVTKSHSRTGFNDLLASTTQMFKNISRFEDSVSLIVTKVDSNKLIRGKLINEMNVKRSTAQFMTEHRSFLETKKFGENEKIKLIDALMKQSANGDYPKMSVFWRPKEIGSFNQIENMVTGRRLIRKSVIQDSSYAEIKHNELDFSLTPAAKISVTKMMQRTIDNIQTILTKLTGQLRTEINNRIKAARGFQKKLELIKLGNDCIESNRNITALCRTQLTETLIKLTNAYHVTIDMLDFNRIIRHENNLIILDSLRGSDSSVSSSSIAQNVDYNTFFDEIVDLLAELEIEIQNGISVSAHETLDYISSVLMSIDGDLLVALRKRLLMIDTRHDKLELLQRGQICIDLTEDYLTLKDRVNQFECLIRAFDIDSIDLDTLLRQENHINALKSQENIFIPIHDWIVNSSKTIKYQSASLQWYSFLDETNQYLTDFDVQKNIDAYNVANLSDWGQANRTNGLIIAEHNFNEFVKRIKRDANFKPTLTKLDELNEIIDVTLKSPPKYECDDNVMTIKGNFVKSSDIRPIECSNFTVKQIRIYVTDTFYIDGDLDLSNSTEIELNIFAPTWNVLKASTFHLNGIDGEAYTQLKTNGTAGRPGNPGTNSGNFFGLANNVINGGLLTIEQIGGKGGEGQHGSGNSNSIVRFDKSEYKEIFVPLFISPERMKGHLMNFIRNESGISTVESLDLDQFHGENTMRPFMDGYKYIFRLHPDQCCGVTGMGGSGGFGGSSGYYYFIETGNSMNNQPKHKRNMGAPGRSGQMGKVCTTIALDVLAVSADVIMALHWITINTYFTISSVSDSRCPAEYIFRNENATKPNPLKHMNLASAVIEYKRFLLENLKNPSLAKTIRTTYDAIESNSDINLAYTLKSFATEARILEEQYFKMHKQIDMQPFYRSLLKRIDTFATESGTVSNKDRNILALIYTALLSKSSSLSNGHKSDLIIDIENFLALTNENIKKRDEIERINVINEQRDKFNYDILNKINDAHEYIENGIQPEIENIFLKLDVEMRQIIAEASKLRTKIEQEKNQQHHVKSIQRNAKLRGFMNVVRTVANVVSTIFGVYGKIVSIAVNGVSKALTDVMGDPDGENSEWSQMPLKEQIQNHSMDRTNAIESVLNNLGAIKNVANPQFNNQLNDLTSMVSEAKADNLTGRNRTDDLLGNAVDYVNEWIFEGNEMPPETVDVLKKSLNAFAMIAYSITEYRAIANDNNKVEQIGNAISQDQEALKAILRFESDLNADLRPIIDELHENLKNIEENLTNRTSVALRMIQWKYIDSLRVVRKKLSNAVSGLVSDHSTNEIVERINNAIDLIIDVFDHIQQYQDQSKLINYLSELHAAGSQSLHIDDIELQNDIDKLELNLQSNLVLAQYNRAIDAFKQAVFPFAAEYMDIFDLPPSITTDGFDTVISIATNKIKMLSKKIVEYNATVINGNDEFIHMAHFTNDRGSKGPFFVWRNEDLENNKIHRLFDGEKIYLNADVTKSGSRNAIKFNQIDLEFRSNNKTINDQLNDILQDFHVTLTHMGESNYRCNNEFYSIASRPLTLDFSFGEKNQEPTDRNVAYEKLSTGIKSLSPYTWWAIQLSHGPFERLKPFADLVDIELHGYGTYVEENAMICKTILAKYYTLVNRIAIPDEPDMMLNSES